jgi:hypothetical protein
MKCSFWKNILGFWLNVKVGIAKFELASHAEVFRQPIFSNPHILNIIGHPLGVCGRSEGCAIANSSYIQIKDLWDPEGRAWKSFQALWMTYHTTDRISREIIISSIPWNPATYTKHFQVGDWISKRISENNTVLAWVYHVTGVTPNTMQVVEFQKVTPIGLIKAVNSQVITVATPLWPSVGVKPNTSKVGDLESSRTPECLEFDIKAQNTSH